MTNKVIYNIKKFDLPNTGQSIKIDKQLKKEADKIAEDNRWSFNTLMNVALQTYLNQRELEKDFLKPIHIIRGRDIEKYEID